MRPIADRLGEVGDELAAIDPQATLEVIIEATSGVIRDLGVVIEEIQGALVDLLRQLGSDASVSISVSAEVSAG